MGKKYCPNCKSDIGDCTHAKGEKIKPTPGDFTICLYCQYILRFDADLSIRKTSKEEIQLLIKENPDLAIGLLMAQGHAKKFMLQRQLKNN